MRLRFKNLPLVEATVRFSTEPMEFGVAEMSRLYAQLANEFPALEDLPGFEQPPGISEFNVSTPKGLIGFRLANPQSGMALGFQSQLLYARWSKTVFEAPYGGHETLKRGLEQAYESLPAAGINTPRLRVVNMVYGNFLPHADAKADLIDDYLNPTINHGGFIKAKTRHRILLSWKEEDDVDLTIDVHQASLSGAGEQQEGYRLATAAGLYLREDQNPWDALEILHQRLLALFVELITDRAKTDWGVEIE